MKLTTLLTGVLMAVSLLAQAPPQRPRITGAAHMAYCVSDLKKARAYYEDFFGFQEAFSLKSPDGSGHVAFIKIDDRQFIELWLEAPRNYGYLHDVAFQTEDAKQVRALRGDTSAEAANKKAEIRKATDAKIMPLLTDAQWKKLEQLRAGREKQDRKKK